MGYRSNVEIVVYGEPEVFDAFMASMKLIEHRVVTDWDNEAFTYHDIKHHDVQVTKLMSFVVSSVEWYDIYDEIIAWEKDFLPKAVAAGLNWEMMRVGEELDDIEHTMGGDDTQYLLYTSTRIGRNF